MVVSINGALFQWNFKMVISNGRTILKTTSWKQKFGKLFFSLTTCMKKRRSTRISRWSLKINLTHKTSLDSKKEKTRTESFGRKTGRKTPRISITDGITTLKRTKMGTISSTANGKSRKVANSSPVRSGARFTIESMTTGRGKHRNIQTTYRTKRIS